jgi:hypothetical protein
MPELRENLPCLSCSSVQAAEVKFFIGQNAYERGQNLSPSGLPMHCCKVTNLGAGPPSGPSAPAAATGMFSGGGRRSAGGWPWNRPPPLSRSPT